MKWLTVILLLIAICDCEAQQTFSRRAGRIAQGGGGDGDSTYRIDTFSGTASNLGGRTAEDPEWRCEPDDGDLYVNGSGAVYVNDTDSDGEIGSRDTSRSYSADQYAWTIMGATLNSGALIGPAVRVSTDCRTYYLLYADANNYYVASVSNGSYDGTIDSGNPGLGAGDTLKLEISGTTLTAYKNSTELYSGTPGVSISTGHPGIAGYGEEAGINVTEWQGGDL